MRLYTLIAILLLISSLTCATFAVDTTKSAPPNIVLILVDDLGYGDVGCYGATKVKTPNIDKLASEGRRFLDAHSASAVCSPSRYALLTGSYPFRKNMWGPLMNPDPLAIAPNQKTIASVLKQQGYVTSCFGKWHLGFGDKMNPDWNLDLKPGPLETGFDYYFGLPVVNSHPPFVWIENHRVLGLDGNDPLVYGGVPPTRQIREKMMKPAISGGKQAHDLYKDELVGTTLSERACAWMRSNKDKSFFLYFATPHIHHPFTPHPRFNGTSEAGVYGDFIHELDWMVGEVQRTLTELHLNDNTLIILTSDNGGMINLGGQEAVALGHRLNGDLLGFKFDAWEGGHRVPFIARWPGKIPSGSVSNQLICHVDLLASLAALSGATLTTADGPDSMDVLPAILGITDLPIREQLIISPQKKTHLAIRQNQWLYISAQGGGGFTGNKVGDHALGGPAALKYEGENNSDVKDGNFIKGAPAAQLYDLIADPRQQQNVIREHPEVAAKLQTLLSESQAKARTAP